MQLAVITDEIDEDFEHALDVMLEYEIRHVELRSAYGQNFSLMTDEEVDRVCGLIDNKGMQAIAIASPIYKADLPETGTGVTGLLHGAPTLGYEDQIELLERCIEIAKRLDAPMIRTFTFWRHGEFTPEVEDRIVDAYAWPARIAEAAGITLVVENEHACYTGTGAEVARVVSRIDSPAVKIVWDPGNAIFAGENPFPAGYEAVKPMMAHIHVKDAKPIGNEGNVDWVVVGEGVANWPAQIAALKADGYTGYLSLETHYSGGGSKEASSRQCLDALKRML